MKLLLLVEGGYDYEQPVVLAICTSEKEQSQLIAKINAAGGMYQPFPWNHIGWLEIESDQLIDWENLYSRTTLVELAQKALS